MGIQVNISTLSDEDLAELDLLVRAELHRRIRRARGEDHRAQERLTPAEWAEEAGISLRSAQRHASRAKLGKLPTREAWSRAKSTI